MKYRNCPKYFNSCHSIIFSKIILSLLFLAGCAEGTSLISDFSSEQTIETPVFETPFDIISDPTTDVTFDPAQEQTFDTIPEPIFDPIPENNIDQSSCFESPCGLIPNCGCSSGMKCSLDSNAQRTCTQAGTGGLRSTCITDSDCAPGYICLATSSDYSTSACFSFCNSDSDCGSANSYCFPLYYNNTPIPGANICSYACTLPPSGASGCPPNHTCDLYEDTSTGRFFTDCNGEVGTGTQGSYCSQERDCAPGYFCYTTDLMCLAYCYVDSPACPAGYTCVDLAVSIGGREIGACYYL